MDGFGLSIPATIPQIGMDPITGWVRDNASPAGEENTMNSSCNEFEHFDTNGHQQGQLSTPVGVPSKGATCEVSPSGDRTSRRRRSKPNAKRSLTSPIKCDWKDCTNPCLFTRDTSLWRHIKEKHIFPDAFKCSSLLCNMSFGRRDKLNEHLRSAHADGEGQEGRYCRSCNAV
ncbi:transcriptional regulator family: C2H2 zinc finger [Penicillium verrucosum]|uniref:transcriptional regulator family: C2H2 zinc finger n=1 Tax=Penicillium verrucosum TaxID=60171 RepID=UPI002545713F|nr:transcriptional regulator family: C2H2 zinc finger [Penicillium verrucosum]KAJ5941237.1 transcriptional regulator family: C2H2 zinc finger [Penicillium verrucosum]